MDHSLSRRSALQSLGAFGLGALLPGAGSAAAAPRRDNHTGGSYHSFSIGEAQCTAILDAKLVLPPPAFGSNVAPEAVTRTLEAYGLPTDGVPTTVSVLLVEVGGERILIDTGAGDWSFDALQMKGQLTPALQTLGVEPGSIDRVVLSHFHPDHVGGAAQDGAPAFPNATYLISQEEQQFLANYEPTGNEQADGTVATAQQMLEPVMSGAETYADGDEIAPGLTALAAPGHTPGHFAFLMESGGEQLMLGSDTANHFLVSFQHPEWLFAFDALPEPTVETRRRLLGRAADEGITYWATHMPFPGIGRVSRDEGGFRFVPMP